jgi:hypothetical protein
VLVVVLVVLVVVLVVQYLERMLLTPNFNLIDKNCNY